MSEALWIPTAERAAATAIAALARRVGADDSMALHRWSIEEPAVFWELVWDDADVIGDRGPGPARDVDGRYFPTARLSYAENLLGHAPAPDADAVIAVDEAGGLRRWSWSELAAEVGAATAALRAEGIRPGDRVAAWMPNVGETIVAMLASSSLGAVFTSTSPDFGVDGVIDRFGQVEPTVLVAADGYHYGGTAHRLADRLRDVVERLPSVRTVVTVSRLGDDLSTVPKRVDWETWLEPHRGTAPAHERFGFDHAGFVLYSSGTTGPPKCIVHRAAGVLLMHLREHRYHCDIQPGDRVLYFTTCGWMMWNWLVSALASGATVVCYDGSPFHPGPSRLFDLVDEHGVTLLGVSAKFLDSCRKADLRPVDTHHLASLRTICSTGSPLHDDGFRYVYDAIAPDVHLASISGGTDLCGCFVGGDPTRPVYAGEIQGPALGMLVDVLDPDGRPCGVDVDGELVCRPDFPTVPLGFWGDTDGSRLHAAYFERFDGWWAHGDFAAWTEHGGMVIHGRSDATLNAGGVRIGTAEIYRIVERLDAVAECIAVGQEWDDDTRIVLFVRMAPGHQLDDALRDEIRGALRSSASPRHVPARILEVADIPRTRSGKISELAVADVVNHRPLRNTEALANPEALDDYRDRAELSG